MAQSQPLQSVPVGAVSPSEPARVGLSSQVPAKYHPHSEPPVEGLSALPVVSIVDPFEQALGRLCVALVRAAAGTRRRERGTSSEVFALLTSPQWQDAMTYDEAHGMSVDDSWQVLVGIGSHCPRHLTPYDGDDMNGRFCLSCEEGVPVPRAFAPGCDACGGSCTDACDAGAGTYWERQEAEARGITVSELREEGR